MLVETSERGAINRSIPDAGTILEIDASNGNAETQFLSPDLWRLLLGQEVDEAELRKGVYGVYLFHDILDRDGEALQGRFTYSSAGAARSSI